MLALSRGDLYRRVIARTPAIACQAAVLAKVQAGLPQTMMVHLYGSSNLVDLPTYRGATAHDQVVNSVVKLHRAELREISISMAKIWHQRRTPQILQQAHHRLLRWPTH
jgi:hypothetical protein